MQREAFLPTSGSSLLEIKRYGQSIWLDNLSRTLLREGGLRAYVERDGVSGVTSNPAIFQKAIADSPYYREEIARLRESGLSPEERFEVLAVADVREACDLLRPLWEATDGDDGFVSLEVSPSLAYDEPGTVAAAQRLYAKVDRPNVLIKVPATPPGVLAFETLTAHGVSVNVTLIFSLLQHMEVMRAYLRGLQRWVAGGGDPRRVKSVASIFLSRVDTLVDKRLEAIGSDEALALRGKSAVAMAKVAYGRYKEIFHGAEFASLRAAGARPQYPLWASTGTKNPAYSDVLYVEPLIGPETINTLPDATLAAFRDHGRAAPTLEQDAEQALNDYLTLERIGINMREVGEELQVAGVKLFQDAFEQLLASLG
ncbi:transaldolase [Thiobacter aerophilum]|uniref:Transaldolase n=1 Tax=Thiobacter aerophilum TaxID=3121275 RepID=A0ABV0EEN6_9BURK